MKKISLFLIVAGAFVYAACHNNDDVTPDVKPPAGAYVKGSHLKGTLKGSLKQDSTYYLDGDVVVNPKDSFGVSPGAKIIVTGNYHIEIAGVLICNGTEEKQITFTPKDETTAYTTLGESGYWGGFLVDSTATYVSVTFTHINYTGGPDAEGSAQASFDVEGSQTFDNGAKIIFEDNWMFGGIDDGLHLAGNITCSIKRNVLQRIGSSDGDLLNIKAGAHGDIAYNYIWSSANSGIKLVTSKTTPLPETKFNIYNNTIVNGNWRKVGELSSAILVDQNAAAKVYNNVIVGCRNGIHFAKSATGADMNNTQYSNNLIFMYYDQASDSTNEETNNPYIPDSNGSKQVSDKIAYGTAACGSVFTTWSNDITVDKADTTVPSLSANSPAVNAGTTGATLFPFTIGASMPLNKDMGAYPKDGTGNKHMPTAKP
jgi:hypothetical protein